LPDFYTFLEKRGRKRKKEKRGKGEGGRVQSHTHGLHGTLSISIVKALINVLYSQILVIMMGAITINIRILGMKKKREEKEKGGGERKR